jgi:ribosomal protein L21E
MNETSPPGPFDVGDRVRIDIPDETRPDHKHHGKNGEVIAVIPIGEQPEASGRFRVELDTGGAVDVGPQDLRPPI